MNIGESLQRARKDKGLTQEEVSKLLYVTRQTISRWEQNKTLPNIHVIKELSFIYDVPINQLLLISPFLLVYLNIARIQEFNSLNAILTMILFPIGVILIKYLKNLTLNLINFFKRYFKFNMKAIYTIED